MLVAIITKVELERYKDLLREVEMFSEFHHCNNPRSEEEQAACTTESELFRLKLDVFWVELAAKYGFDNRQPLTLDMFSGEIRVVPRSPKTY